MKRNWIFLALMGMLIALGEGQAFCQELKKEMESQGVQSSKKSERNRTAYKHFSIQFPKNWKTSQKDEGNTIVARSPEGPYMMVWIEDLKKEMSGDEYFQESRATIKNDPEFVAEIETGKSAIDGSEVQWATFFQMIAGKKHQVLQYWTVKGLRGFNISGAAEPDQFGEFKGRFAAISQSFKVSASSKKK